MKKHMITAVVAAIAVAGLSILVVAQHGQPKKKEGRDDRYRNKAAMQAPFMSACRTEIQANCAAVKTGESAIAKCLAASGSLSEACSSALPKNKQKPGFMEAGKKACAGDAKKFCAGSKDVMKCLTANKAGLSAGCRAFSAKLQKNARSGREACKEDVQKLCADVEPGPAVLGCLESRKTELSAPCAAAFKSAR